jgi:hypothetical protein
MSVKARIYETIGILLIVLVFALLAIFCRGGRKSSEQIGSGASAQESQRAVAAEQREENAHNAAGYLVSQYSTSPDFRIRKSITGYLYKRCQHELYVTPFYGEKVCMKRSLFALFLLLSFTMGVFAQMGMAEPRSLDTIVADIEKQQNVASLDQVAVDKVAPDVLEELGDAVMGEIIGNDNMHARMDKMLG